MRLGVGIWSEWQPIAPGSPWMVNTFTYHDLPTGHLLTIGDVGQDEGFAGGFYLGDYLLGIDLTTGLVWWGEVERDRYGDSRFDGGGLQGHLVEVQLRASRSRTTELRCHYADRGVLL